MVHSRTPLVVLALATLALATAAASAQTDAPRPPEKTFSLKHQRADTTGLARQARAQEETKPHYTPRIETGKLELGMTLGYLDLNQTFIKHPHRMIYKRTDEFTYYGRVFLQGESAFNPVMRLSYNLTPWFGLENVSGISVSEYRSVIDSTVAFSNEVGSGLRVDNPPLGEYDAERRSCITLSSSLNAIIYPLNLGSSEGRASRWHPYLTGGVGRSWYSLNSNYTDRTAGAWNLSGGGGLRLIADDLISVRLEVVYNRATVEFEPSENFTVENEGTLPIPLYEWQQGAAPKPVESFAAQTLSSLSWGFGFTASF